MVSLDGERKGLNSSCYFILYKPRKKEVKMGKIILKNAVSRKPGHLYYVDGSGNVCEAVMARGGKKKKAAKKSAKKKRL